MKSRRQQIKLQFFKILQRNNHETDDELKTFDDVCRYHLPKSVRIVTLVNALFQFNDLIWNQQRCQLWGYSQFKSFSEQKNMYILVFETNQMTMRIFHVFQTKWLSSFFLKGKFVNIFKRKLIHLTVLTDCNIECDDLTIDDERMKATIQRCHEK